MEGKVSPSYEQKENKFKFIAKTLGLLGGMRFSRNTGLNLGLFLTQNLPDLIEYAFVGVSFQMQNLWEESIKMNHTTQFTNVCACQITDFCAII